MMQRLQWWTLNVAVPVGLLLIVILAGFAQAYVDLVLKPQRYAEEFHRAKAINQGTKE